MGGGAHVGNWDGRKKSATRCNKHAPVYLGSTLRGAFKGPQNKRGLSGQLLLFSCTEFGRDGSTFQKGANGRDRNPERVQRVRLAGAGVKRGFSYGATDDHSVSGGGRRNDDLAVYTPRCCTPLRAVKPAERLSFYNNGIERRLTDVDGQTFLNKILV